MLAGLALSPSTAQPVEGRDYLRVQPPQPTNDANRVVVTEFFSQQGVDKAAFTASYNSFSVNAFATRAEQTARTYRIPSVPALAVDGKYLAPISDNGDFAAQLALVDALIDRARAERAR
jgi:thiol:disulfide interchange protein DsbA